MTNRYWLPITFLIAGFCFFCYSAEAQFPPNPKSRPAAAPQATQAQTSTPPVQAAPIEVAAPAVHVAPQLVAPAPGWMDQIQSWLNTVFAGGIFGLLAKIGFGGLKTSAPVVPGDVTPVSAVRSDIVDILTKLKDPDNLAGLEAIGLKIVQSGVPGQLIQGAASLTPAGPIVALGEPYVRKIVMDILSQRSGVPLDDTTAGPVVNQLAGVQNLLHQVLGKLDQKGA